MQYVSTGLNVLSTGRLSVCLSFRRVPVFYDFYVAIRVLAVSVLIKV